MRGTFLTRYYRPQRAADGLLARANRSISLPGRHFVILHKHFLSRPRGGGSHELTTFSIDDMSAADMKAILSADLDQL